MGLWFGTCGYADDLILLAPNRDVLQRRLQVCEGYAAEHNLVFSTDPSPTKSKSKCVLFCGKPGKVSHPDSLQIDGKDLPLVETAEHLEHTLHQVSNMDKDCKRARARFIAKSLEVRNQLSFADPKIIMKALQIFCTDAYGSMLWDLSSEGAESFFKCWNTNVKLVYGLPRNTFTYLVEGFFAEDSTSLRNQIFSRYSGFYRKLLLSPSKEVQFLARIVASDPRSTTCKNLKHLSKKTSMAQPHFYSPERIKAALPVQLVPEAEQWRLGLLSSLLIVRDEKLNRVEDTRHICAMIESLCST
jgi:hypothetical protein